MKKLFLIITGALLLSACSSTNQISITQSRYGNGIGISFGNNGLTAAEEAKADQLRQAAHERVEHQKFVRGLTNIQRKPSVLKSDLELKMEPIKVNQALAALTLTTKIDAVSSTPSETLIISKSIQNQMNADVPEGLKPESTLKTATPVINAKKKGWLSDESNTLLLVILALLLSPVAVYLYEGEWTNRVTLNLVLWLLCGIPGIIHALIVILGKK